jgi:hypothetical protein
MGVEIAAAGMARDRRAERGILIAVADGIAERARAAMPIRDMAA